MSRLLFLLLFLLFLLFSLSLYGLYSLFVCVVCFSCTVNVRLLVFLCLLLPGMYYRMGIRYSADGHRAQGLVRRADSRAERLLNIQERLLHVPDGSLGMGLALPRLDQRHTRFVHPGVLMRTGDWSPWQQRRRWQRWRWRRRRHRRQRRLAHDQALELLAAPRGHVEVVARPIHGARRLSHDLVAVEATRTTDPKHILTDTSKARVPRGVSIPVLQTFVLQDELLYQSWI
jgi:hypothetical protein